MKIKKISITGSTGSIGRQALDIIKIDKSKSFEIMALSAGNNLPLFIDQIKEFRPKYVSIVNGDHRAEIENLFPEITVLKDIEEIASIADIDIFLNAVVGIAGLEANLIALEHAKRVAVANKETLVVAGHLVKKICEQYGSELMPVDSEHVAIHQCLAGVPYGNLIVKEILLTSSGGPFRTLAKEKFKDITIQDALKHPTWKMGQKITIDSSTLMNKCLEIIEVNALFGIPYDKIRVIIHPQSIVHSAVTFVDGNTLAQISNPDMRIPIQYAFYYPERIICPYSNFDICAVEKLEFFEPDREKFPALDLAYEAGKLGHSYPAVLNAANEAAVALFLERRINYLDITKIIEKELNKHQVIKNPDLKDILHVHKQVVDTVKTKAAFVE